MTNKKNNAVLNPGGDPNISQRQGNALFKMGIKQMTNDSVDIYLYGEVQPAWSDWWTGEKHEEMSSDYFKRVLVDENPNAKQINLFINSPGGDVFEGTAMANILRRHPAKVTAVIDGFACSVASVIAMAADEVYMPANAMFMVHNMWTWTVGNASELRKVADDLDKMMEANRTIYLDKVGDKLSEEKLIELLDAETWLTAEECLEYGFCDEIMKSEKVDDSTLKNLDTLEQNLEDRFNRIKEMQKVKYNTISKSDVNLTLETTAEKVNIELPTVTIETGPIVTGPIDTNTQESYLTGFLKGANK